MSNKITVKIGKRYLTREKRLAFVHTDGSYNGKKIYWYVITGDSTQYFCDEHGKNLGDCCGYRKIDIRDLLENKDE